MPHAASEFADEATRCSKGRFPLGGVGEGFQTINGVQESGGGGLLLNHKELGIGRGFTPPARVAFCDPSVSPGELRPAEVYAEVSVMAGAHSGVVATGRVRGERHFRIVIS